MVWYTKLALKILDVRFYFRETLMTIPEIHKTPLARMARVRRRGRIRPEGEACSQEGRVPARAPRIPAKFPTATIMRNSFRSNFLMS